MDERSLKVLEFNKIKQQLTNYATSPLGEEKAEKLQPSFNYEEVVKWQAETDEAATIYRLKGTVPLTGVYDIRPHLKRAQIGGVLNGEELMQIGSTIRASRRLKRFIEETSEEDNISLPILRSYTEEIIVLASLQETINNAVDEDGKIVDSASEQLRLIRLQTKTAQSRIRERLDKIIRSSSADKRLSEKIITIRNERFVIPVKHEYRSYYGGVVHDESASGQTLFIEPQSVLQLNNELQHHRVKEQVEIEKILVELSQYIAGNIFELETIVNVLGQLDFIFAKAMYGKAINGSKPIINNEGKIELFRARHPLIPKDEVVANDISIGDEYRTIVITGPNTGGKTVALKTVGLTTLMAQSGLQIPALDGSKVAVFNAVYADIGDEQSIEQSLSTFSSHMVNIVSILNKVDSDSLVLFDELGAGTDPQEGTALAISILDEVHNKGARVIATTHYPELKAYGYNRDGVINASVEFNVETLSPTYKLLIGIPGRSNAFEIASRLGLNERLIKDAKSYVNIESNEVEEMIASLQHSKQTAQLEEAEAKTYLQEAEQLHKQLQEQFFDYEQYKEAMYEKARVQAEEIVAKAKLEAEQIIKDLRKLRLEKGAEVKEHELIEAKKRLDQSVTELPKSKVKKQSRSHTYKEGDEVRVLTLNQKGSLLERVNDQEWQVQIGIMKMKVSEEDMEFIAQEKLVETKPLATIKGRSYHVSLELDLRGERYEDALIKVEKYLDDALLAGHPQVSIIHGKGTGALREGVQTYLKNHRSVKKIRFGSAGEGGTGVTIVTLQ